MKQRITNSVNTSFNNKYKIFGLCLVILLSGCGSGSRHGNGNETGESSDYVVSGVSVAPSLLTGNPASVTFTLSSKKVVENADLSFALVSTEDSTKRYFVDTEVASLNRSGTTVSTTFIVPENLQDGSYKLTVSIEKADGAQGVLIENKTITIAELNISTPTLPELVVSSTKLGNNSFSLGQEPDDENKILSGMGEIQLDLVLNSRYKSLNSNVDVSVDLNLEGLGVYPLDLTAGIVVRDPNANDHHRSIGKAGKVTERVKGQMRSLNATCKGLGEQQLCSIIRKNSFRHVNFDLHLNEAAYAALKANGSDVRGSIIVKIASGAIMENPEYELPIIYLHQSDQEQIVAAKPKAGATPVGPEHAVYAAKSSSVNQSGEVDEIRVASSGDVEYLAHTTTTTANTLTGSNGQAFSNQSQDISVSLSDHVTRNPADTSATVPQNYAMATMTTSVNSGANEDINNSQFGLTLDSMGGTIWDIHESVGSASTLNAPMKSSYYKQEKTESTAAAYNPQDEMVWRYCANEGGFCDLRGKLPGTAQVRYGNSNGWVYKIITEYVNCDNGTWGDPAHKQAKTCEYLVPPSFAPTWQWCAGEYSACTSAVPEDIRFGRHIDWSTGHASGNVSCSTATFGDPARGQTKVCEYMTDKGAPPLNYEYVHCAAEGAFCAFSGSAVVRYGHDSGNGLFYVYNIKRDGVTCNNSIAGDPRHTVSKSCDYLRYIDPNTRQNASNKIWSTQEEEELGGAEKVLVEVGFSKDMTMRTFWGFKFTAEVSVSGEAGLKVNGYLDSANKTFSLIGGPYVDVDSSASGYVHDIFGITEVGITAPINVLDIYSPYTAALTVRPGVLTAELSLDYFLDLMYGEVEVYYEYDDYIFYQTSDSQTIFHWDPLYQTTGNLFKGTKAWKVALIKDYIIPAIPDGYFSQRIGFPSPEAGKDYYLLVAGVLTSNADPDADNPNEFVDVAIMCGDVVERAFTFTGTVNEEILLGGCAEAIVSGIRSTDWPEGNRLTLGIREK